MTNVINAIYNALIAAGCEEVFYEADKLANVKMDESHQVKIIALILQPNQITLNVKANAIQEQYLPESIEILQQVRLEDNAMNNEVILNNLCEMCKKFIYKIIEFSQDSTMDATFAKITSMTIYKVIENKYDANVIGWSMPLNLIYLFNETKPFCP
jgi:spore maturation protein CgeB